MSLRDHRFLKGTRGQIANHKLLQDEEKRLKPGTSYNMLTGIVKDVISNPYDYLKREYDDSGNTLQDLLTGRYLPEIGSPPTPTDFSINIKNSWAIDTMPLNSIFAYIVDENLGKDKGEYIICYPFFPPHLSLPLKAGEYVWITTETIGNLNYYYWMCRKVAPRQIDDVNYTNYERIPAVDKYLQVTQKNNQKSYNTDDVYSLKEAKNKFFKRLNDAGTNSPESLDGIFKDSYSHVKEFTGEPVPRLAKNCGDLLLQGSNNSGIHLTTEKFSEATSSTRNSFGLGTRTNSNRRSLSSAIDLFVGRKKDSLENNQFASRTSLANIKREKSDKLNFAANIANDESFEFVENDKIADARLGNMDIYDTELKDIQEDATDVAARLYLSHECQPDSIFGTIFADLPGSSGKSIITYAQNNRVVGEDNVRIVSKAGDSFLNLDNQGNILLKTTMGGGRQYLNLLSDGITRLHSLNKVQISRGPNEEATPEIELVDGNTTITGGDVTLTGVNMLIEGGEITSSGFDINLNARQTINIAAGTISRPGTTAVLSSKVGGVKVVQNVNSQGGPLLSVKPILDFIEAYEALGTAPFATNPAKAAFLSTAGAAAPVIGTLIDSGLAKQAIEQLSTKYFYAE